MRDSNLKFSKNTTNYILKEIIDWVLTFGITFLLALIIFGNVFSITRIDGRSMEPTLSDKDRVIIYKLRYSFKNPKAGDIVVINKLESKKGFFVNTIEQAKDIIESISNKITGNQRVKYIVKRVIAVPGDVLDIKDGKVYVNAKEIEESYIKGETIANSNLEYPLIVPERKVFVLGDNRENSLDSRIIGLIDYDQVKGKLTLRLFPFSTFGMMY